MSSSYLRAPPVTGRATTTASTTTTSRAIASDHCANRLARPGSPQRHRHGAEATAGVRHGGLAAETSECPPVSAAERAPPAAPRLTHPPAGHWPLAKRWRCCILSQPPRRAHPGGAPACSVTRSTNASRSLFFLRTAQIFVTATRRSVGGRCSS